MVKPILIFQSPIATRSGYGEISRKLARILLDLNTFDIRFLSTPWGNTPANALDGTLPLDQEIIKRIQQPPITTPRQPEIFIQVSIPNEFQSPAKYNIGFTAGIETNMCSEQWIEGCNRMNLVLGTSSHAIRSIQETVVHKHSPQGQQIGEVKTHIPMDVLPAFVDTKIFHKTDSADIPETVKSKLAIIPEKFAFLFVGHWLKGGLREDRKNVALLIKLFCETFSSVVAQNRPALLLKTSGADFSILDREEILQKIRAIRDLIPNAPNVYLIHGDLSEEEMNGIYNHPKVKVFVSLTKGEGFGIPLLEASMSEKPIIASGWSGQLDFLNPKDAILIGGELKPIEPGAVWENILIPQSSWFNVDEEFTKKALNLVFKQYEKFLPGAIALAKKNKEKFGYEAIKTKTKSLLEQYLPKFDIPEEIPMKMPSLDELPKLQKIE